MVWHKKIIGHTAQKKRLEMMAQSGTLPNAFLFTGPGSIGKFRLARHFLQILNSEDPSLVRDIEKNLCPGIVTLGDLWQAGKMEDWGVISKSSNFDQHHRTGKDGGAPRRTNTIGVRDIHQFLEPLTKFSVAPWKAGIIRDAHRLTTEAANALLKVLEEPPKKNGVHSHSASFSSPSRDHCFQMPNISIRTPFLGHPGPICSGKFSGLRGSRRSHHDLSRTQ